MGHSIHHRCMYNKGEISFETPGREVAQAHFCNKRLLLISSEKRETPRVLDLELSAQAYFTRFISYALPNVTR